MLLALALTLLAIRVSAEELTTRELKLIIDEHDRQYGQRFDAQEKAVAAALAAAKEAVVKQDAASEKRFDSVNEFRNTLKDQTGTFVTRAELMGFMFGMISLVIGAMALFYRSQQHNAKDSA